MAQVKIVIVGAGIAGLMLATRLGRRFRGDTSVDVRLVDKAPIHVWKPMLHSFAAGTAHAHSEGMPLVAQAKRAGFTYFPGAICGLDAQAKTLEIEIDDLPGKDRLSHTLDYDILVIAIGSTANDFSVPGVREHCHFIDDLASAEALNRAVRAELVEKLATGDRVEAAIVGGGATGVEFAADLASLASIGAHFGAAGLPAQLKITLLNSGARILDAFPEATSSDVQSQLEALGVEVRNGARVVRATDAGFELKEGGLCAAPLRVWAAGVRAPAVLASLGGLDLAPSGHILVDQHLRAAGTPDIFAMGDCARHTPAGAERALPPTGQVARQQADFLFRALQAHLKGKALPEFQYTDMGSLVSLSQFGAYGALAKRGVLPTLALKGWPAKLAHKLFYRMHQFGLYGPLSGTVVMARDGLDRIVRPTIRLD
ncbi:MAG: NAD(P)/FAD-dependent oxidoreductase [Pseudomonadota bacterium]